MALHDRPVVLLTGQFSTLPFDEVCAFAASCGFDGLEISAENGHFDVVQALHDRGYLDGVWKTLQAHNLRRTVSFSVHMCGHLLRNRIDPLNRALARAVPKDIWGDGNPHGIRARAANRVASAARALRRFVDLAPEGVETLQPVLTTFTGSEPLWPGSNTTTWEMSYPFPAIGDDELDDAFKRYGNGLRPVLDLCHNEGVRFALEIHPGQMAFDTHTALRALAAVDNHPAFGFNFDPSHLEYCRVDYLELLRVLGPRIFHVHMKDTQLAPGRGRISTWGGAGFGTPGRPWDFRAVGRGTIDWERVMCELNGIEYGNPLSVEVEDPFMDPKENASQSLAAVRRLNYQPARRRRDGVLGL